MQQRILNLEYSSAAPGRLTGPGELSPSLSHAQVGQKHGPSHSHWCPHSCSSCMALVFDVPHQLLLVWYQLPALGPINPVFLCMPWDDITDETSSFWMLLSSKAERKLLIHTLGICLKIGITDFCLFSSSCPHCWFSGVWWRCPGLMFCQFMV